MIIPALLFPMFFFTAFAGGLSRVDQIPGFDYHAGYTTFVYGFVLLQASTFGGIFTGLLGGARLRVGLLAPAAAGGRGAASGIVAGYWLAALTRAIFTVAMITAVALIAGLTVDGNLVDLAGLYTLALLVNAAAMLFGTGHRDAAAHDAGRARDADAGVPAAVPGAGLGAVSTCSPAG